MMAAVPSSSHVHSENSTLLSERSTDQESQSTRNEVLTLSDQEEFRKSIISDVLVAIQSSFPVMLGQIRPQTQTDINFDTISINADKYRLVDDDGIPEGSPSVTNNVPKDLSFENNKSDNFSDLFPDPIPRNDPQHLDVTEDILVQVDNLMPQEVDLGGKVRENLAKRVVAHFKVKSQQSSIKTEICNRHKIPSNCTELAVPKMNKCIMGMKSFNEFQKRNERTYYNIQSILARATSAIVHTMDTMLKAD